MDMRLDLIPPGTRLTANGEGQRYEIAASETRTFMCNMFITDQIEQESVDISVWGSADGQDFGKLPLLKMPQRFSARNGILLVGAVAHRTRCLYWGLISLKSRHSRKTLLCLRLRNSRVLRNSSIIS